MGLAQKCITGTQTFPIGKLGDWKHIITFHKSPKKSRQQALKHLRQSYVMENARTCFIGTVRFKEDKEKWQVGKTRRMNVEKSKASTKKVPSA